MLSDQNKIHFWNSTNRTRIVFLILILVIFWVKLFKVSGVYLRVANDVLPGYKISQYLQPKYQFVSFVHNPVVLRFSNSLCGLLEYLSYLPNLSPIHKRNAETESFQHFAMKNVDFRFTSLQNESSIELYVWNHKSFFRDRQITYLNKFAFTDARKHKQGNLLKKNVMRIQRD